MPGGRRTLYLVLCAALAFGAVARGDPDTGAKSVGTLRSLPRPCWLADRALRQPLYGGLRIHGLNRHDPPLCRLPGGTGAAGGSCSLGCMSSGTFPNLSQVPLLTRGTDAPPRNQIQDEAG